MHIEKHACRRLLKSYQIVEDEDLVESVEDKDDDVLNTYLRMLALLKNDRKRKINDTKDEDF